MDNHLAVRTLGPNAMVAFNTRYLADLAGPGRLGFIATNGLHDCAVIDGEQEDEYRRRLREGWHPFEGLEQRLLGGLHHIEGEHGVAAGEKYARAQRGRDCR